MRKFISLSTNCQPSVISQFSIHLSNGPLAHKNRITAHNSQVAMEMIVLHNAICIH